MGRSKRLLMEAEEDERPIPSHLVKEMFNELVSLKKRMKLIQQIVEGSDEKDDPHNNDDDTSRV